LKSLPKGHFDVVMCLELLYNLPDPAQNLQKLAMLLKPGGVLITSHRSPGYYLFRFIREKNYEAANLILQAKHPDYNAQTVDELKTLCLQSDLELLQLVPIGLFSGFGSDAFSGIANPAKMSEQNKLALSRFETNHDLSQMFGNSARYNLMIGRQK
jgi:SAM-dependent methyltransferase